MSVLPTIAALIGRSVKMAQWWSDYLDQLRDGGEVVPLRTGS